MEEVEYRRKPIPKALRQRVYEKYNGHCAYCGKQLAYKDMQVDHLIPLGRSIYSTTKEERDEVQQMIDSGDINNLDNLMPACRACNFYKSAERLDVFRSSIADILSKSCRSTFQAKLAMQYGMLKFKPWDGKFYFEKVAEIADQRKEIIGKTADFLRAVFTGNTAMLAVLENELALLKKSDEGGSILLENLMLGLKIKIEEYIDKLHNL